MKRLAQKLNCRRGASMLMALLLFLIAAMVSAVIITAAVSARSRVASDCAQQQTYLTVSSAAELLRDSIEGGSGDFRTRKVTLYSDRYKQNPVRDVSDDKTDATGDFAFLMNNAIRQLLQTPALVYQRSFTIRAKQAGVYEDVSCELYLSCEIESETTRAYTLTVWLTGGTSAHPCRMRLTMDGTQTYSSLMTSYWEWEGWSRKEYFQEVLTSSFVWSGAALTREDGT